MAAATGVVKYWNGQSGWITLDDVAEQHTAGARDMMILASDVVSGSVEQNSTVGFTIANYGDWRATEISVT